MLKVNPSNTSWEETAVLLKNGVTVLIDNSKDIYNEIIMTYDKGLNRYKMYSLSTIRNGEIDSQENGYMRLFSHYKIASASDLESLVSIENFKL